MMLELSDQGFKTTVIYMLTTLMNKEQHTRTEEKCKQKGRNPTEEPKRNARDQKHCNRNEEYLYWAY